jgi:hypothetical protein
MTFHRYILLFCLFLILPFNVTGQADGRQHHQPPKEWIQKGSTEGVMGLGVAPYSSFNPDKAWKEALQNGIEDLNANHSMIVYHYGYQVGRGPMRTRSRYAIRNFLDSTQVAVVDSARWKDKAFVWIKPTNTVPDSVIYPSGNFRDLNEEVASSVSSPSGQWLQWTGRTPRIDSNWHMAITKAKQDALRRLAGYLATRVSTKTYSKGASSRRYLSFSTMFAFQRVRVLQRTFNPDSVKVKVAVDPREVKMLME